MYVLCHYVLICNNIISIIGNKLIKILAEAISSLPLLEVIILRDNNAFDDGLEAIVKSISRLHNIVELDISSNKVGSKTATALGMYLVKM